MPKNAYTQMDKENKQALDMIADFADRICEKVPLTGTGEHVELSGDAKAELKGLLQKIANLGIEGAAKYQEEKWSGVLQKDIATILEKRIECKKEIWNDLKYKIFASSSKKKPNVQLVDIQVSPSIVTVGDKLTINYTIENKDNIPIDVWLGATLKSPQNKMYYNIAEDEIVTLKPGIDTYSRTLTAEVDISSCIYQLVVEVWFGPITDPKRSELLGQKTKKIEVKPYNGISNFQNFEIDNNTSDNSNINDYCRSIWYASCNFESKIVHSGNRSIRVDVKGHSNSNETGGTVRIFLTTNPLNFFSVNAISIWVYDTQGDNTVELKLCNSDSCPDKVWSGKQATKNNWTEITWPISEFKNVDKKNVTAIELYEWNEGVYYFDNITYH